MVKPRIGNIYRIAKEHDINDGKAKNWHDKWKADEKMDQDHQQVTWAKDDDQNSGRENHASTKETHQTLKFLLEKTLDENMMLKIQKCVIQ